MSKGPSLKLNRLIKSLSKNEKGNFKKLSAKYSGRSSSKYIDLFDEIEKQDSYNESEVKNTLQRKGYQKVNLARTKSYLYAQILESLDDSEAYRTVPNDIRELFRSTEILFEKGLSEDALKFVNKAMALANKYDYYEQVLEGIMWGRKILQGSTDYYVIDTEFKKMAQQEQEALLKLSNLVAYRNFFSETYVRVRHREVNRVRPDDEYWGNFLDHDLLKSESNALSISAKILFFNIQSSYHFSRGQLTQARKTIKGLIDLLEKNPHRLKERIIQYFSSLNNLIAVCDQLNDENEFTIAMDKLRAVPDRYDLSRHQVIETRIFERTYLFELTRYNRLGRFGKAMWLHRQIEKKMNYFDARLSPQKRLLLYLGMAVTNFGNRDYSSCIKWLNKIFNIPDIDPRLNFYSYAYFLHLICHYEMKNTDILPYIIRTSYKQFYREGNLGKFEKIMMKYLNLFIKSNDTEMPKELVSSLNRELSALEHDENEVEVFYYFDFLAWVRSKLERIDFETAVRNRNV